MVDERTSLFAESRPGPSYAFPGRAPRTQHQRQLKRFQCCICTSFITVLGITFIIAIIYAISGSDSSSNTNDQPTFRRRSAGSAALRLQVLNASDVLNLMVVTAWPMIDEFDDVWRLPQPTERQTQAAIDAGIKALGDKELLEENTASPTVNSPSFRHQRAVSTTLAARVLAKRGYVENQATMQYMREHDHRKPAQRWSIGRGPAIRLPAPSTATRCDPLARYRNPNGTCNNRGQPLRFGVAMLPFRRALQPDYADGVAAPRRSVRNGTLPSARLVSLGVHRPSYSSDPKFTVMLAVFGQFLDHDITATALNQAQDGKPIDCCTDGAASEQLHPECFPVQSGRGDPNYDRYNISCMNFVRSAPAPTGHFGPRQQLNQATAFIDGSVVYGVLDERVQRLRANEFGLLRMFNTPDNRTLLPVSTDPLDGCNEAQQNARGRYCFESGDTRGNENLHLTAMHLLWARHHNYLAGGLRSVNPHWDDERLFQEARRLLAAQLQHITFNEFLVTLLGEEYTREVGIQSHPRVDEMELMGREDEAADTYDERVDASIANVFAACAFRFAHTLIPGLMNMTKDPTTPEYIELHRMLFNPYSLWAAGGLDTAIGSAIDTPLAKSDRYFTRELTEKLFQDPMSSKFQPYREMRFVGDGSTNASEPERMSARTSTPTPEVTTSTTTTTTSAPTTRRTVGLDLVSLNIQRGRDHGLAAYGEWRRYCGLPPADTWEEMADAVDEESLRSMRAIFKDAVDVDLYTGALSEPPMMGAIIGPTLTCLITDQFMRIKRGDSFWFERTAGPQIFTKPQLRQIHGTTLAGIICRNSDAVQRAQQYVMRKVSDDNPVIDCGRLDTFDFGPWRESGPHYATVYSQAQSRVRVQSVPMPDANHTVAASVRTPLV